jgi:ATP-dependent Lhr-like helicase
MKLSEEKIVTGATVTLELGIDIGSLDQVVQIGSRHRVELCAEARPLRQAGPDPPASFYLRRRGARRRFRGPRADNWSFIRSIAIVELYTKEKWLEPLPPAKYPYSLLYHQTMSHLVSVAEATPRKLAQDILGLKSFGHIPEEDYGLLLRHLIGIQHIQETENGGLIIGRKGERVVNDFRFLAVFLVPEYYLVKDENSAIARWTRSIRSGPAFRSRAAPGKRSRRTRRLRRFL